MRSATKKGSDAFFDIVELEEMQAMLAETVKTWTEEWKQLGLQQGIAQGRHQGEANLLRRQLLRRFGPLPSWVDQRLEQASEAELGVWGERVLDAERLEDIFGA
jgi:hypothetical protein